MLVLFDNNIPRGLARALKAHTVIAGTSPINYLVLIGYIDILPSLFEKIVLSSVGREELAVAPPVVRQWIASSPSWVEIRSTTGETSYAPAGGMFRRTAQSPITVSC